MKQLSTEFDKWMNYCEHTNTLWFEVLKYWLRLLYLASLIYHEMLKIILNILCSIQACIDICTHILIIKIRKSEYGRLHFSLDDT